ncbi:MAG: alpha-hydroxy-acid oxidizing protein [Acidaminococcales bacterium]|jgi:isopentenyl diphosphate isomerase/L-lactate dehydrogenase-like FMN-dependent dehydrogenase|nr:alpha-hydroxy-acid oxidizing protein [Acidaminococcales bacterium]
MDKAVLRDLGREKFGKFCRVCNTCDGVACAGEIPGMGGVLTGRSFQNNIMALRDVLLRQRIVHSAGNPDTGCEVFGVKMAAPVIAAPIGGISYNLNDFTPEGDYARSIVAGAAQSGCLGMTGDGGPEIIYRSGIEAITEAGGRGIPTIKPRPNRDIIRQAETAARAGAPAVAADIDSAALINMTRLNQPVGPKTEREIAELAKEIKLPLIIKGVMTVEDAKASLAAGAAGIVVSNHGGRVLDHTPGTAMALPEIARAVKGKMAVWVDGGVRTGVDVLKMLALGADAVLVGRPFAQAAAGGANGVAFAFAAMIDQLKMAMIMTGASKLADIDGSFIYRREK